MQVLKTSPGITVSNHFGFETLVFVLILISTAPIRASDSPDGGPAAFSLESSEISLAGQWAVQLDPKNVGESEKWAERKLAGSIRLPGSTAEGGLGEKDDRMDVNRWTPRYSYIGAAWYQRAIDVPSEWRAKRIVLFLERCMWATDVWVDGKKAGGREDSLLTPHVHVLGALTPGTHSLTLRVDNSRIWDLGYWSHAYSPEIQTIWNGVIGRIELRATDQVWIDRVDVYGDPDTKRARVRVVLGGGGAPAQRVESKVSIDIPPLAKTEGTITSGTGEFTLDLGEKAKLWDEFTPVTYRASVQIPGDQKTVTFGLRKLTTDQHHFYVNARLTYFRGTHDGGSFPLTGYPSTKVEDWRRIFTIGKSYGLNHFRFHSWTPPEAAFVAADEVGVYLQCELPLFSLFMTNFGLPWTRNGGGRIGSPRTDPFMLAELDRVLAAYGNHPSLCLLSMGNELKGNVALTDDWTADSRKKEPRILFASFSNPASAGRPGPGPNDQFMVFHGSRQERRGERIFNTEFPSTDRDYDASLRNVSVPTLSHEVGQWAVFPNMREIEKYTGILRPTNLEVVRDQLTAAGLSGQADKFLIASGKFSLQLYREEIERSLRSADEAGFQLLDLHDYAGQGSAFVGILDSFWDSKGIVTPEEFRQFCAPNVLLARMPKRVWRNTETPEIGLEVASYGVQPLGAVEPIWTLRTLGNEVVASGKLPPQNLARLGLLKLGAVKIPLGSVWEATCCEFRVEIPGAGLLNSWKLWVYPASLPAEPADVLVTSNWENAKAALNIGSKVLFTPHDAKVPISFTPPFWNNRQAANRPSNHGLRIDYGHPALATFPTDFHADWQWRELMRNSHAAMFDKGLPQDYRPIVQPIDQPFRDAKLGAVFELAGGSGRLMVCTMDIETDLEHRLVARQLRSSLLRYMAGDKFQPKTPYTEARCEELR